VVELARDGLPRLTGPEASVPGRALAARHGDSGRSHGRRQRATGPSSPSGTLRNGPGASPTGGQGGDRDSGS
jgi:hypothetical protein